MVLTWRTTTLEIFYSNSSGMRERIVGLVQNVSPNFDLMITIVTAILVNQP